MQIHKCPVCGYEGPNGVLSISDPSGSVELVSWMSDDHSVRGSQSANICGNCGIVYCRSINFKELGGLNG